MTVAPVRFSNSSRTLVKLACSGPVHTAATDIFSPSSFGRLTVDALSSLLPELFPEPLPALSLPPSSPLHPVRASAPMAVNTSAALRMRRVLRIPAPSLLRFTSVVRTVLCPAHRRRNTAACANSVIVMGS